MELELEERRYMEDIYGNKITNQRNPIFFVNNIETEKSDDEEKNENHEVRTTCRSLVLH